MAGDRPLARRGGRGGGAGRAVPGRVRRRGGRLLRAVRVRPGRRNGALVRDVPTEPAPEETVAAVTLADLEAAIRASWSREHLRRPGRVDGREPVARPVRRDRGRPSLVPRWRDPGRRRPPRRPAPRAPRLEPPAVWADARSHARPVPRRRAARRTRGPGADAARERARASCAPGRARCRSSGRVGSEVAVEPRDERGGCAATRS